MLPDPSLPTSEHPLLGLPGTLGGGGGCIYRVQAVAGKGNEDVNYSLKASIGQEREASPADSRALTAEALSAGDCRDLPQEMRSALPRSRPWPGPHLLTLAAREGLDLHTAIAVLSRWVRGGNPLEPAASG